MARDEIDEVVVELRFVKSIEYCGSVINDGNDDTFRESEEGRVIVGEDVNVLDVFVGDFVSGSGM